MKAIELVTEELRKAIGQISSPRIDLNFGDVREIERDESAIYFGLFELEADSNMLSLQPTVIWTVEVTVGMAEENE